MLCGRFVLFGAYLLRRRDCRRWCPLLLHDLRARHVGSHNQYEQAVRGAGQPVGFLVLARRGALNVDRQAAIRVRFQTSGSIAYRVTIDWVGSEVIGWVVQSDGPEAVDLGQLPGGEPNSVSLGAIEGLSGTVHSGVVVNRFLWLVGDNAAQALQGATQ